MKLLTVSIIHHILGALLFLVLLNSCIIAHQLEHHAPSLSAKISKFLESETGPTVDPHRLEGTRWALLVAGSRGYENYRHQADVCHAFQILKKGGLREENVIVFMYDDIAFDVNNPRPGVIVNSPGGDNVYEGVPKDYTGRNSSIQNLFAVILGNKSALTGGSGKVLDSGPKDHIFIYYSDHGSPGTVAMPCDEYIYADDLINVLKKKNEANAYESMVFYLEACESGSMFDGLLPETLNIYASTAANATEDSYATYCPDDYPYTPPAYDVCLGDVYSVSWMEDSEKHDLRSETLEQQLQLVILSIKGDKSLKTYHQTWWWHINSKSGKPAGSRPPSLLAQVLKSPERKDSIRRVEAQKQLTSEINSRMLVGNRMKQISSSLAGVKSGIAILHTVRPEGQPLVDDWRCLKTLVKTYEEHCGSLTRYGMKYMRAFANMCNAGIMVEQMNKAAAGMCNPV